MPFDKVYILDTNALLNDPEVVYAFSGAEVVVPAGVLKELDNLKRRRTDRRIRFHGRKATRLLYDVSRNGHLIEGVPLTNGSLLRIDATDHFENVPADLDLKRTDDQILALAYTVDQEPGVHVTVVSNDLNLLLRGEALGLDSYRFEGKLEQLHEQRRTPMEWFRDNGLTAVLSLLTVIFAATTIYLVATRPDPQQADLGIPDDPIALQVLGVSPAVLENRYKDALAKNPDDVRALVNMANLLADQQRYLESVDYYRRALALEPANGGVRSDMGIALLRLDRYDESIEAFRQAAVDSPDSALAHYNLGVALSIPNKSGDPRTAISELKKALTLAQQGKGNIPVIDTQNLIKELERRIQATPQT